ncbi:esterase FE4-like [Periplaneta americana]|uniref:esterase FE4-like n=1 Tax=Periplaneta americana TaxID=6978 RepID=UPI0037E7B2EC
MSRTEMMTSTVSALLLATCFAAVSSQGQSGDPLVVSTAQGYLRGSVLTSRKGRTIYSYRGVRFANPPVGELRFKAPQPPDSWDGVRNATEDGFACPQPEADTEIPTSEDCLFLNVYTTELPTNDSNPNRSVLVFFHAGGWYSVTAASSLYGPQYLMDQDIVLVTTNYRLAALGFLSTGDDVLPGNYGMKDQVATLRWVQQNIATFGGNPNSVTIGGYSVGGASGWFHMMSPMSRGLFHRIISMSPSINTFWDLNNNPMDQAKRQAALLNCPQDTSKQIADCLRGKKAQDIASTFNGMLDWGYDPLLPFTPVVEQESTEERFLSESPMKILQEGNFVNVPYMTGMNKDEFNYRALDVINNSSWADDMYNNFETVFPIVCMYEQGTNKSRTVSGVFKELYLNNEPITLHSFAGLGNLYSDAFIRYGQDLISKTVANISKEPVYSYLFEYQGRYSHRYWPGTKTPIGVSHHDDLIYLFYISLLFPEFKTEDPESQMVEKLTKLWANFIQTGNPTPEPQELLDNVTWHGMTSNNLYYLSIDSQLQMEEGMFQDRMTIWDQFFPPK